MEVSSCINCNCDFTSSEPKIDIICMTDQDRRVKEMPVIDILSEIYRLDLIDCLFIESEEEEESSFCCDNTNQNSGSSGPSSSSSPLKRKTKMMKAMCTSCFDKFKNLYEYYVEFNLIRHSASYLSKEIKKLDTFISQLGNQTTDPSSRRLIETNDGEKQQQQQDHNNSSRQDESGVADCDMVILSDDEEDDQVDDDELTNLDKDTGTGSTQAIDPLFINPASNSNQPESFNDDSEGMDVCFPVFDNEEIRVLNEVVVVCEVNNAEQTPTDIPPPPTPCTSIISTETNIESSSSPSTSTATTQTTTAGPDDGDPLGATQNIVKIVSSSSSPSSSKIITKPPVKKRVANSSRGTNQAIIDNQQTTTTPRLELNKEVIVEFQCDTCFETFNLLEIFQQHVAAAHNHSTCQNSSSSSIEHVSSVRDNDNDQNEQQQQGSSGSRPNETGIESISQPKQKIVSATSNQTTRFGHGHRVIVTYSTKASPAPGQLLRPAPAGGGGENATRNSVVHAGPQVTTGPGPSTSAGSAAQPNPTTTGEEAATTVILVTRPIRRRRRGLRRKRKRPSKAHFTQKSPYWTQDLLFPPPRAGVKVTALAHVPIPENGPPYECPHCLDLSTDQVTTFDLASAYEKHVKEEHFGLKNENLNADTDDPAAADGVESIGISDDDEMSDNERAERDSQNTVTTIFSKTGLSYTFKDCPPFQCPYCDLRGGTLDVIRNHIKGHHFNLDLTCATCFEVFLSRTDLSNHLTDCIPPEGGGGGGSSRSNRNQSSSTGGADDGQLFICEFCGKECLKSVYLKKHKQRVHGDDNAFPCTVCRKSFRTRTYLSRHMDCHVESRDFICHQCGNGFKSSHHLRMHVRRVHR